MIKSKDNIENMIQSIIEIMKHNAPEENAPAIALAENALEIIRRDDYDKIRRVCLSYLITYPAEKNGNKQRVMWEKARDICRVEREK